MSKKSVMNAKRRRFVEEYLLDLNATQAAIRAGYGAKTARQAGAELMEYVEVKEEIREAINARAARTLVNQDRVLDELAVVSFSNVDDYTVDEDGNLALAEDARPDAMRAIASVKRKRRVIPQKDSEPIVEVEVEYKLWSKPETLRLSGQHLGMYIEKREITLPKGTGVLAVPVPLTDEQWSAAAAKQQADLVARPATVGEPTGAGT